MRKHGGDCPITSTPSRNVMPSMTLGKRFHPFSRRQDLVAALIEVNTISLAVFRKPFAIAPIYRSSGLCDAIRGSVQV